MHYNKNTNSPQDRWEKGQKEMLKAEKDVHWL